MQYTAIVHHQAFLVLIESCTCWWLYFALVGRWEVKDPTFIIITFRIIILMHLWFVLGSMDYIFSMD